MTIEDIRKFRNSDPFKPFHVHLSDGRKLLVRNPENIGFSDTSPMVAVFETPAACDMIQLRQIVDLSDAKNPTRKHGRRLQNGKKQ
jgi:hypothetical protein